MTLPDVAASKLALAAPESLTAASEADVLNFPGAAERVESTQVGFVHVALKQHLELAPAKESRAIVERVKQIRTKGEAKLYLREVKALLDAKAANRAPGRSKAKARPKPSSRKGGNRPTKTRKSRRKR